jgi:hypothetical protein
MVRLLLNKTTVLTHNMEQNLSTTLQKGFPTIKDFVHLVENSPSYQSDPEINCGGPLL